MFGPRLAPQPLALEQSLSAAELAHERGWHAVEADVLNHVAVFQPWRPGLWEHIGVEELAAGQPERAVKAFQQAEMRQDLTSSGRAAHGEAHWTQGDVELALEVWHPLLTRGQAEETLYQRAAEYWRAAGEQTALAEVLQAWYTAYPESGVQAAYELGILLLPGSVEEARGYLQSASRADAGLRVHIYRIEQALDRAASEANASFGQVLVGRALASAGEWGAAERTFKLAVQIDPDFVDAWAFLAEARQQTGANGRTALDTALAMDPKSVAARTLAALYWRREGRPEVGLDYLEQLASEHPDQGLWQIEMGNTLAEMGEYEEALVYLQRAVEIEPENAEYWRIVGRFCIDNHLELREIGLPAARQALLLAPANPDMLDLMGLVLLQLEDQVGAERFLQRALQMDPALAAAHLHLGQLYLNQGKNQLAVYHLTQARDTNGAGSPEVPVIASRLLKRYYPGVQ